ncbi:ras and Rab interactor 3-like isoform X1 [Conger conger]|uniref:ras and Rab interactor 3-like isoform X1 n=1 Tax=Conger conger TaxID=82655 RepID=UPI002A5A00C6|nr:ras and Rab interactor 3-like isoform X1 [Conger conger]
MKAAVITQDMGSSLGMTPELCSTTRPGTKSALSSRPTPPPFYPKSPTPKPQTPKPFPPVKLTCTMTPSTLSGTTSLLHAKFISSSTTSSWPPPLPSSIPSAPPPSTCGPILPSTSRPTLPSTSNTTPPIPLASLPSPPFLKQSTHPGISILEKLIKTCPVWLQLGMAPERSNSILQREVPGIFLVRKNTNLERMVLSVRLPDQHEAPQLQDLIIKEDKSFIYLEGSVLVFDDIFKLIAFYCISRDILPFTLRLPHAIAQASKYEDMEMMTHLGSGFWSSSLHNCSDKRQGCIRRADLPSQSNANNHPNQKSCEIKLSVGNDRLCYVNPIFTEEYCSSLTENTPIITGINQNMTTSGQAVPRYKRLPPLPPQLHPTEEFPPTVKPARDQAGEPSLSIAPCPLIYTARKRQEVESDTSSRVSTPAQAHQAQQSSSQEACSSAQSPVCNSERVDSAVQPLQKNLSKACPSEQLPCSSEPQPFPRKRIPPVPPRSRASKKHPEHPAVEEESNMPKEDESQGTVPIATLIYIDDTTMVVGQKGALQERNATPNRPTVSSTISPTSLKKPPPVPPPRKMRLSRHLTPNPSSEGPGEQGEGLPRTSSTPTPTHSSAFVMGGSKGADISLFSPEGQVALLDLDSSSSSSAEEETEIPIQTLCPSTVTTVTAKLHNSNVILDKAKQKLSRVNLSSVLTGFMSADKKLKKQVLALSRDGNSYFGNLVRDYRAFTLETMHRHNSSIELLQEIRLMMNQLKCYLVQSAELKTLLEPTVYPEEKLEVIIESALCKSVLKPLKEAVYSGLRDIHTREGSLRRLEVNQQAVLSTTTTDLGITTSLPEAPIMEKIQVKLASLHREYSPEKKNSLLVKTCKIIYESMSVGCPGRAQGADDFLPVLIYVVARSNMVALLHDVEYMMELMDPKLELGGFYYLTATYGALAHIKNYDKREGPWQLSLEIKDSIQCWERRRTLYKANVSQSCVQDFINVSFLEAGSNTKTLGAHSDTTAQDLCLQCAEKFEVLGQESYMLCVLVDGQYRPLAPSELPLSVKSNLYHSDPRRDYFFVYRPGSWTKEANLPDPPPTLSDSLI